MVTDKREPTAVANPIGNRVPGKRSEVKYTPGTRTSEMDKILCKKLSPERPQAQKYPLKQKCTPAKCRQASA
jgi:hypothetical protein